MIDEYKLGSELFGKENLEESAKKAETTVIYGVAASDSLDGVVSVIIDGQTTAEGQAVEMPTTAKILKGDPVVITLSGGKAKTPLVTGTPGGGDRTFEYAADAKTAAQQAVADAWTAKTAAFWV